MRSGSFAANRAASWSNLASGFIASWAAAAAITARLSFAPRRSKDCSASPCLCRAAKWCWQMKVISAIRFCFRPNKSSGVIPMTCLLRRHVIGITPDDLFGRKQNRIAEITFICQHHFAALQRHGLAEQSFERRGANDSRAVMAAAAAQLAIKPLARLDQDAARLAANEPLL